ncbi:hypothetical protein EON64_17780, partial [archaeon]
MDEEAKIERFLAWLKQHGARFPKLRWPVVVDEATGLRGCIAVEDIAPLEPMLTLPCLLMMDPVHAFADPHVGAALLGCQDVLEGDLLLTVYLMHEMCKGPASFFAPYLDTLPPPDCLSEWPLGDLLLLKDTALLQQTERRRRQLREMYARAVEG